MRCVPFFPLLAILCVSFFVHKNQATKKVTDKVIAINNILICLDQSSQFRSRTSTSGWVTVWDVLFFFLAFSPSLQIM